MSNLFAGRLGDELTHGWVAKARPSQLPPPGDAWSIWLLLGGRGMGKTRTLSEWVNHMAASGQAGRIALVGATAADVRDVLVEGESGILECASSWSRPDYQPTRRRLIWPNGALGFLYSAEESDRLRGPQHDAAVCDELASWRDPSTFDMLMLGLRLGQHPRTVAATTPRPTRLIRELLAREGRDVVVTRGTTYENSTNLAPAFLDTIIKRYENTRLGRQELLGEVLLDLPGALWSIDVIDMARRAEAPDLQRVVVAIDPAISTSEGSDETGIVVCGKDDRGHGFVIEDLSGRYQPDAWARTAISAYRRHTADRIVAEANQGGNMVEATLRTVDPNVPVTLVRASRGKYVRAEPVAALFEQGRIHHVGLLPELEDQMVLFTPDMDRARSGSPDRADAMIWALTELMVEAEPYAGLFTWYRQEVERMTGTVKSEDAKTGEPAPPLPPAPPPQHETYPILGAHAGEPTTMMPTRAPGGGIRFIPVQR